MPDTNDIIEVQAEKRRRVHDGEPGLHKPLRTRQEKHAGSPGPPVSSQGLIGRFVTLHKHFAGLLVGGYIARFHSLPLYKRKGLHALGRRFLIFVLKPFIKKELRHEAFSVQLRRRLEMLGPTYMKLGQIMAIREDILPKAVTDELKLLLDRVPPASFESIRQVIEQSFGIPLEAQFLHVEATPFGSASLAQTHLATTITAEQVILKILKPGIRETVLTDLKLLRMLARLLQLLAPQYQPQVIIEEFCTYTEKEIDLTYEADHAEIFAANFVRNPDVVFPRVYREFTTRDVLTMEFLDGIRPTDPKIHEYSSEDLHTIIDLGTGAIIKMLYQDGFFHADLHAGNLIVLPGPKVGFIDVGMVGRFDEMLRRSMLFYFHYLVNGDIENSSFHLMRMATVGRDGDPNGFKRAVCDLSMRYQLNASQGKFSLAQLILESIAIGGKYRFFFPVEMTLMVKALVTFEGVGLMMDPKLDVPGLSRKHIYAIYAGRYNPEYLFEQLTRRLPEFIDVLVRFPKLLSDGARSLDEFVNRPAQESPLQNLSGLTTSMMAGACVVAGTVAAVQGGHWILWAGLYASSIAFYFLRK